MAEFHWKLKDKDGKIYGQKDLSFLTKAYRQGEIADGDLLFQSDESKPWVEMSDLNKFFLSFEKQDIVKKGKLIDQKILDARTYHLTFLLFVFIFLTAAAVYLGITGRLISEVFIYSFSLQIRIIVIILVVFLLFALMFIPVIFFYAAIWRWKEKIKTYFLQQGEEESEEKIFLSKTETLSKNLTASLEKQTLIRNILNSAIKISQFSAGFILTHDYHFNRFRYETALNIDRTMFTKLEFQLDEPIIREIMRTKEINWVEDVNKNGYDCFAQSDKIPGLGKIHSLVLIPLVVEEEVLGILGLYGTKKNYITLKQNQLLSSILKNQASLALGSAIQSELAIIDRLTGLSNHEYFMTRLREEIERSRRFHLDISLLMIDIDLFKQVNDTYGHQAGDKILKTVAAILKDNLRIVDFCGRYGGEEFAVLLVDTAIEGAKTKAEQLRKAVRENPFVVNKHNLKITISIGLSTWRWQEDNNISDEELIKRADEELYRAKEEGRDRTCFVVNGKPQTLS